MSSLLHWFRRDLRVRDNTALHAAALKAGGGGSVTGVFIIDPRWWRAEAGKLGRHQAAFWLQSLTELRTAMGERNMQLVIRTDSDPVAAILKLAQQVKADAITLNKEYEPAQIEMDARLERAATELKLPIACYKDAAIFEEEEILTQQSEIYSVFTPYKNAYLKRLAAEPPEVLRLPRPMHACTDVATEGVPSPESLGFGPTSLDIIPGERSAADMLEKFCRQALGGYAETRDVPALSIPPAQSGTSRLSAHLNAGTLSIRQAMHTVLAFLQAKKLTIENKKSAEVFLSELVWREFYRMILFNFPHTVSEPFKESYRHVTWANSPAHLAAWQNAQTGYPIVDAAMEQLRQTGFMHNRLRMIAAMFLTKDLDTHWIRGERYFMRTLMDYDQASNVGGWQWSASTGTDAAPYFRVMNPVLQSERFDPAGRFIRHFLPALRLVPNEYVHAPWKMPLTVQRAANCMIGSNYPAPIVDHATAKEAAIAKFRKRK